MRSSRVLLFLIAVLVARSGFADAADPAAELDRRYAPRVDWRAVVDAEDLHLPASAKSWRTAAEIRNARGENALPLSGLRLVLDPGHIGGVWAEAEGRHFRIGEDDFPVREGELVLEVAGRVRRHCRPSAPGSP
jgi:hypothetical protein